jgi:sialidase-1
MKTKMTVMIALLLAICFSASSQKSKKANKLTSNGYWIHEKLQEMPYLPSGPFVKLGDGSILTIEKNMSLISKDGGKNWTKYPIFEDTARFDIRVERVLLRTKAGVIILAFANDKERANWAWQNDIADSPGAMLPTYVIRSLDEGKTWQDLQKLHHEWTGANRDIIETKDGNIVFTSMMLRHNPGHHTVITYTSMTNGLTWIRSNVIDLGGVGHHSGVTESTIEQLKDGRLWMLLRTNWGVFWETYSDNEGLTWKNYKPTKIDASSAPGILKRLQSGRLILVWNRNSLEGQPPVLPRPGDGISTEVASSGNRAEFSMMFSDDDGKTWTDPVVIARITDQSKVKRLSYPRFFEPTPGEIWITTTYSGFAGYLAVKFLEKDFVGK